MTRMLFHDEPRVLEVQQEQQLPDQQAETGLSLTDQRVLSLIATSGLGMSFQGIRRSLGIHQESLSRSLKRLVELGLIHKEKDDYWASDSLIESNKDWYVVVDSSLPEGVSGSLVAARLRGRCFRGLRWLGESPDSTRLAWTTEEGSYTVMLRIMKDELVVLTDSDSRQAVLMAIKLAGYAMEELVSAQAPPR